jgi:hypothetical protein
MAFGWGLNRVEIRSRRGDRMGCVWAVWGFIERVASRVHHVRFKRSRIIYRIRKSSSSSKRYYRSNQEIMSKINQLRSASVNEGETHERMAFTGPGWMTTVYRYPGFVEGTSWASNRYTRWAKTKRSSNQARQTRQQSLLGGDTSCRDSLCLRRRRR